VCGICGKLNFDPQRPVAESLVRSMAQAISHRGPDGEGVHIEGQLGLGHRRLAIIDLTTGQQPLSNEDGTVWIVFNGEIYNYQDLRSGLLSRGHRFKTKSDTEVIVHLYEELGEKCVEMLRGMFAFAIWDSRAETLLLARDRVGIKPLYYWMNGRSLVFASEIKALLTDPEIEPQVQTAMVDRFLTFNYLPGEATLFRRINKLPAASCLLARNGRVTVSPYWDLDFTPHPQGLKKAASELEALLEECVRLHMISDVPVGVLLSGGVDSTAMLGLAAGKSEHSLSSYTLGFTSPGITDERPYARLAARTYGSRHHELSITATDFQGFLPEYVWHMEEPVCEPPAIALYFVSKLAKNYVKVLLSGEGGDEAFGGYQNYRSTLWLERSKRLLKPLNGTISAGLSLLNRSIGSARIAKYAPLMSTPFDSYYYSRTSSPASFFNAGVSSFYSDEFAASVHKEQSLQVVKKHLERAAGYDLLSKMLYVDTKTWLTDDLLLKADKMTMANSVELRVPLLDHRLLEFAASLPSNFKVRGFTTKYIAKRVLNRRVPREILDRRKVGFPVPYESWLRSEMKDWLWALLLDQEAVARGYFKKQAVEYLLSENARSGNYSKELFSLAVLELWHRVFLKPKTIRKPTEAGV
jgi:asparagine synthase (glutamine-hydrolysing)